MRKRWLECLVATVLLAPVTAMAANVTVSNAWFRALPSNLPAGGYFVLKNSGTKDLTLTGAQSAACGMLMLHKSTESSGMDMMSDVSSIDVAVGATVTFAPGGYHLMCMNPKSSLKPGADVPVTLQFSDGSTASATFAVKNARGK